MASKEALEKISTKQAAIELFNIVSNGKYDMNDLVSYFDRIDKALTELEELKRYPTIDDVCKALSEYFKDVINYDGTLGFTRGKLIYWYENDELEIYDKLPPHLITLIGRFYEGLEKVGKEE